MRKKLVPLTGRFTDRTHAGQVLATALDHYAGHEEDTVVLALPRGGVPVAFEVAMALHTPMDLIVARKLGLPGWEELAMGAISCGGVRILNDDLILRSNIRQPQIEAVAARELTELHRQEIAYRGRTGSPRVTGKTVLLIDDGVATGLSILAAVRVLRAQEPAAIVIGVPVASAEALEMLKPEVDDFVALMIPANFSSVSQWYDDFDQTSDATVKALLAETKCRTREMEPGFS